MTVNEEIDVLETTGLPPMEFLVLLGSRVRTTRR
jgi:ABC-type transporter Mla maintaining outer membrane lipid asymmetry permease subunit MlaE